MRLKNIRLAHFSWGSILGREPNERSMNYKKCKPEAALDYGPRRREDSHVGFPRDIKCKHLRFLLKHNMPAMILPLLLMLHRPIASATLQSLVFSQLE